MTDHRDHEERDRNDRDRSELEFVDDDPKSREERLHKERNTEKDAPMAPSQNRPPAEQHRGGPLPNQKK